MLLCAHLSFFIVSAANPSPTSLRRSLVPYHLSQLTFVVLVSQSCFCGPSPGVPLAGVLGSFASLGVSAGPAPAAAGSSPRPNIASSLSILVCSSSGYSFLKGK